jgi:hypothetical protein
MRGIGSILGTSLLVVCNAAALAGEPATRGAATEPSDGEVRFYMNVRINDQPVRLIFDTGSEDLFLFRPCADRLKLKVTDPSPDFRPAPGQVAIGKTEKCQLSIGNEKGTRQFGVADLPENMRGAASGIDGVFGWCGVRGNILRLTADEGRVVDLAELPKDIGQWTKYDLLKDSPVLAFRVPAGDGANMGIMIDTGNSGGVGLSAEHWRKWRRDNADRSATMVGMWIPAAGLAAYEVCWAEKFLLGSLSVANVPVTECPIVGRGPLKDCQASLGLFALTRLDVIVDWNHGCLYVRPMHQPQWYYPYNRLGAVFLPGGSKGSDLAAHVVDRSPAYEAGIRNGDVLLKIDGLDVTKSGTDPSVPPQKRFWSRPAGTKLRLTLKRDGKPLEITVVLKEIFNQVQPPHPSSRPAESSPIFLKPGPATPPLGSRP